MTMIDLMSAAQTAIYNALEQAVDPALCAVYDAVPQETLPPFLKVGTIDTDNQSSKAEQLEQLSVEVIAVYRGDDRGVLLAMMHAARTAIDKRPLTAAGVAFQLPHFLKATASDASPQDGVTYAGVLNFDVWCEPA